VQQPPALDLEHLGDAIEIFAGILERVVDDLNREHWQPQMEDGKAARKLPGIVD
jgi:hypothetical protein